MTEHPICSQHASLPASEDYIISDAQGCENLVGGSSVKEASGPASVSILSRHKQRRRVAWSWVGGWRQICRALVVWLCSQELHADGVEECCSPPLPPSGLLLAKGVACGSRSVYFV